MQRNYWPTTEWKPLDLNELNNYSKKFSEIDTVIKSKYTNINGILIVKNGYIAYEKYYNGFGPDDTHHLASVTKSIISALIGIAIDKGFIKDVNQKVLDFFPEFVPNPANKQKQEITIRHLLTMTAPYQYEDWHEPFEEMCMQPDWIKYILKILGENGTIGTFKYSTLGSHLLSAIITRSTGKSAREFANKHLFKPIGIKERLDCKMNSFEFEDLFGENVREWVYDPSGNSTGGWGITLTTQDMARFGYLYLNHGFWGKEEIIPPKWIHETINMNNNKYGYLWWLREDDGIFAYLALGDGGNVICCIPEKDLVIAIASEVLINSSDRWPLIKEYIISALCE